MNKSIKSAIGSTVQDLLSLGVKTTFTEKELKSLGVKIPEVIVAPSEIQSIRKSIRLSQQVFAKVLNVSPSSVRQWEQGAKNPTGATMVLLDLLKRQPHILDYRIQ